MYEKVDLIVETCKENDRWSGVKRLLYVTRVVVR